MVRARPDAQMPAGALGNVGHRAHRGIHCAQDRTRLQQQRLPHCRQMQPVTRTFEQRGSELVFESTDAFGQCGLAAADPLGRQAQLPQLGSGNEMAKVSNLHDYRK